MSLPVTGTKPACMVRRRSTVRASAFQEVCHPESAHLEKALTAQLTRIDAADRLFFVPFTRITSVPECAV
jgi:hypothetical protein